MATKNGNLKKGFRRIGTFFSAHKMIFLIFLILIPLVYVGTVFYYYAWQIDVINMPGTQRIAVDQALYKKVMDSISKRQDNFSAEQGKNYADPFK